MVIKTFAVLLSLMVLLLSPRAPSSSPPSSSSSFDGSYNNNNDDNNNNNDRPLGSSGSALDGAHSPLFLSPRRLRHGTSDARLRTVRGSERPSNVDVSNDDNDDDGGDRCDRHNKKCCDQPVPKKLSIGKLIPLETHKHYLESHVWLMRCPGKYGCCASMRQQCGPTETEQVRFNIPVEVSNKKNEFAYVNESHLFENHVKCECRERTNQGFANYISRELLANYDAEHALHMVHRICKAVQRRIRRLHRYDAGRRFRHKRKRRPKREVC